MAILLLYTAGASAQIMVREYVNLDTGEVYARDKIMSVSALLVMPPSPGGHIQVTEVEKARALERRPPTREWMYASLAAVPGILLGWLIGRTGRKA